MGFNTVAVLACYRIFASYASLSFVLRYHYHAMVVLDSPASRTSPVYMGVKLGSHPDPISTIYASSVGRRYNTRLEYYAIHARQ